MKNLWMRLAGIMRFQQCTIEGAGGGEGGGAGAGGGAAAGAGGGGAPTTPTAATPPPSTSVSAGAGAPAETQEISSTLTDDGGRPVRELGETGEAFLARFREYKEKHDVAAPPVKTAAEIAAEAEKARLAAAPVETPEQKIAREAKERAAAAETPEAKLAREKAEKDEADRKAAAAATPPGGEIYDLAPIPTETLAEAIKAHPVETEAFLKATGLTQDQLFANSRLAGMAGEFMKAGVPTIEAAKHAVAKARAFHHLDDSFTSLKAGDVAGTGKFLNDVLLPLSYMRDEQGNVRVDPTTKMPITDGSVFTFMDNVIGVKGDFRAKQIERDGEQAIGDVFSNPDLAGLLDAVIKVGKKVGGDKGDELQAAAMALKRAGRAAPIDDENLPPEVKARLAKAAEAETEAKERAKQTDEREAAAFDTKVATFKENVLSETSTSLDKIIGDFLDKTSLKDETFVRPTVISKIRAALYESMSSDAIYLSQRDGITVGGPTAKVGKEWLALNLNEAKARLKTVSDPILADAKVTFLRRADQRKKEIEGQQKRSQMETHGGTHTALPTAAAGKNDHELVEQAKENLRSRGEDISTMSIMSEFRKLKTQPAA